MKKFFIACAILISISMFLPFIRDVSLIELYSYATDNGLKTDGIISTILVLLIGTWFLAIGYSKKVKISILGIIGALIYLYFYFKIFGFIGDNMGTASDGYRYSNEIIGNKATNNIVLSTIKEAGNQLSIGFYLLVIGFFLNGFAIINIVKNLYKLSGNINHEKIEEIKQEKNIKKEKIEEKTGKEKLKITGIFIISNILTLIISIFVWSYIIDSITMVGPKINMSTPLGILLSTIALNLYLTNKYINNFIENKKLLKYIGVGFIIFIIFAFIKG